MKVTVVPAQVTTVEDRIIGNLSPSQVLLIVTPVFIGAGIYAVLPPFMEVSFAKMLFISTLILTCSLLAVKVKGKLLASWLSILVRYFIRPTYYIHDKNSLSGRPEYSSNQPVPEVEHQPTKVPERIENLDSVTIFNARDALIDPSRKVSFKVNKNGGLHVRYSEIED